MMTSTLEQKPTEKAFDDDEDVDDLLDKFIEEDNPKNTEISSDKNEEDNDNDNRSKSPSRGRFFASDSESDTEEKGQQETVGEKDSSVLSEDSSLPDDQRRAMEELENQRIAEEEPPEYDVTERVKQLNQALKDEPMPDEDKPHRISFKEDLVDLVAPPPDYSDDETPKNESNSPKSPTKSSEKENKVLMERGGKFELVNADEVTADDFGLPVFDNDKENKDTSNYGASSDFNRKPQPPSKPRPATATGSSASRRSYRPSQKPRAQSATTRNVNDSSALNNFSYNSPYALSDEEKRMLEQRQQHRKEVEEEENRRKKREEEKKREENDSAFKVWLKKVSEREQARRRQEKEEQKEKKEKRKNRESNNYMDEDSDDESSIDGETTEQDEKLKFDSWLNGKLSQMKQEKLLEKRQMQEKNEGFLTRSREQCDKAFKAWLRRKNSEFKKAKAAEKSKARLLRLTARRQRKTQSANKAIKQSNAFRYVDYYGYRF